jgi:sarcosine oxidase subunit gamma
MPELAQRREPLDGIPAISQRSKLTIAAVPPRLRYSLRGSETVAKAAGKAFGLELPQAINRATVDGDRIAFRLGPDEWHLMGASVGPIETDEAFSLVEISHRNTAIAVSGSAAADVLAAHVMLDLDLAAFPVGMATRTLLTKAEILLFRDTISSFQIEVWRSFAPYVFGLLSEAAREHLK